MNRRQYLATAVSTLSVSGCLRLQSSETSNQTTRSTTSPNITTEEPGTGIIRRDMAIEKEWSISTRVLDPEVHSGQLYFQEFTPAPRIGAVDSFGDRVWTSDTLRDGDSVILPSVSVSQSAVFVGVDGSRSPDGDDRIVAFSTADGQIEWTTSLETGEAITNNTRSAFIGDETVFFTLSETNTDLTSIQGYDVRQGTLETALETGIEASPLELLSYQDTGIAVYPTEVLQFNLEGREIFREDSYTSGISASRLVDGVVYTISNSTASAVSLDDQRRLWVTDVSGTYTSPPTVHDDYTILTSEDGQVTGVETATGEIVWNMSFTTKITNQPVILDRVVWITTNGTLFGLALDSGEKLFEQRFLNWNADLPLRTIGDMLFVGGRVGSGFSIHSN